ncbi:PID-CTERM protein-sorting domain-containing protein [uncultured Hymenobacter sp.]|uniref:PID-CTERM protein-sorting domain-containing protein n=1 Tax=uncultured Hymenobacter sp. TaxID=170016 RepID=UPI0035CC4A8A
MKSSTINFRFSLSALLASLMLILVSSPTQAQGPGSGGPTPTAVPIDGGVSLLLAAGGALALRHLRRKSRN